MMSYTSSFSILYHHIVIVNTQFISYGCTIGLSDKLNKDIYLYRLHMKRVLAVLVVVIIAMSTLGCTDPPKPPASDLPKLVVDYNPLSANHTILYVHGIGETRYQNITLKINDDILIQKNDSFSLEYRTNMTQLHIVLELWLDNNFYYYNASYSLVLIEDIVYEITRADGEIDVVRHGDLPYSERLTKVVIEEHA